MKIFQIFAECASSIKIYKMRYKRKCVGSACHISSSRCTYDLPLWT